MTLLDFAFYGGIALCVVIVVFVAVLVLAAHTHPTGYEQVPDDAEHVISDAPPPPYPSGGDQQQT